MTDLWQLLGRLALTSVRAPDPGDTGCGEAVGGGRWAVGGGRWAVGGGRGAGCGVRGAGCGVRGAGCGVRGAGLGCGRDTGSETRGPVDYWHEDQPMRLN